jgi:hypothetical protein
MNKNEPTITVTRTSEDRFSVRTSTLLSDGTYRQDGCMKLVGNALRSHEERGIIRVDGILRLRLGEKSLPVVQALKVGETANFFYV